MRSTQTYAKAILAIATMATIAAGCGSSSAAGDSTTSAAANAGGAGSASQLAPVSGPYHPDINPADFTSKIDNKYFPLVPGTSFLYKGVAEDGKTKQTDRMTVTSRTKKILGVDSVVVRDVVSQHGAVAEKTFDWYAQDKYGNVWYMGENTKEKQGGHFVKQDDSWTGGVDGAEPGIIMPGHPRKGDEYRQEYYPGHAMDQARVLGSGGPVTVPYGSYKDSLATVETSPSLDPGVVERKYYVKGVGDVWEHTVRGDHEQIKLVRVTTR